MVSLVGGMDLSGNNYAESSRYIGIVIGTQEKIDRVIRRLGLPPSHTAMDKSGTNRSAVASSLMFDDGEIVAFCAKIDKVRIIDQIKKKIRKRRKYFETERI